METLTPDKISTETDLDASKQIALFKDFFEKNHETEILEKIRKGEKFIVVDFFQLTRFSPEIADLLLEQPEEVLKGAEMALEHIEEKAKGFAVRIKNLSPSSKLMISNIRSIHLEKFHLFEGVVRIKTEVRPQVTSARFECPSCGNVLSILQLDNKFKEPQRCSCGRKGKFRLLTKELVDAQGLTLEEVPEQLEGGEQPKRITVLLKNDLVSPFSEKKTSPGSRVVIAGHIKEIPIILRSGGQSTKFDIIIEANYIESIQEDFVDINIDEEEKKQIIELSQDKELSKKMVQSLAPSIYGHEKIKEALTLQLMGGVRKVRDDGVVTRGDMHILLVGDPGAAKSQLLKRISIISPKSKYITGKSASAAGLSATVVRDEILQGWSLEAGALVLAHKGICCIDELDKMSKEDSWALHEALEQQSITISKANIQASLRCETTVLAAANPKWGRFDPYDTVASQIDLPPTLINRFDLIFPIKDLPDVNKDEKMASFILELHKNNVEKPAVNTKLLRKYIAFAKQNVFPKLTDAAVEELKNYYIKMRGSATGEGIKTIPISARQLEGLVRLSEASARLRLSDKVLQSDAQKAIELLDYCLRQVAYDEKTGTIDIDRIAAEIPATQRNKIILVKEIIVELENMLGKNIPIDEIAKKCEEKGLSEIDVEEVLQKLKRGGDIFEPKKGFISKI